MITLTYRFYWYDMTQEYKEKDRVLNKCMTWSMKTKEELDLYAVYKAKDIGAFKLELYDERELLKGI